MSEISDKILNKIKDKKILPKPKWHFLMRQVLIWLATVISIIVGSVSFSMIIFRIVNNDWDFIKYIDRTPLAHAFSTLPYIWILVMILFGILAYYNAKHTKGAYKYNGYWLALISIFVSVALGGILYAFGVAPRIHTASERIPILKDLMYDRDRIWMENEDQFLAGKIIKMLSGVGMFEVRDLNENNWVVRPADEYFPPPEHFVLEEGVMIRIFGEKIDTGTFEAIKIMPYEMGPGVHRGGGPGYMMNRGGPMHINY